MAPVQHNIEDKTFRSLIKRYLKKRDLEFVRRLLDDYGRVLADREEEAKPKTGPLEAVCKKCGQTFVPEDEDDTIHLQTDEGLDCGGEGEITREYVGVN